MFYWLKNSEYFEKTTDIPKVTENLNQMVLFFYNNIFSLKTHTICIMFYILNILNTITKQAW